MEGLLASLKENMNASSLDLLSIPQSGGTARRSNTYCKYEITQPVREVRARDVSLGELEPHSVQYLLLYICHFLPMRPAILLKTVTISIPHAVLENPREHNTSHYTVSKCRLCYCRSPVAQRYLVTL